MISARNNQITGKGVVDGSLEAVDLSMGIQERLAVIELRQSYIAEHQFTRAYATIYAEEVDVSIADLGGANNYNQIVAFAANTVFKSAVPDHTENHITIKHGGFYLVAFSLSFSSNNANETFKAAVHCDDGTAEHKQIHAHRKVGGANDAGSMSGAGIAYFAAGATVELFVACSTAANKELATLDVSLSVVRVA